MDLKSRILSLLRTSEEYVSGQELCDGFGVSRTAVWKAVNLLKEEGYEIEAVKNKGYKLMSYPDSIAKSEIASRLHTKWMRKELHYLDETGSTNNDVKRLAEEGSIPGTIVVADCQSSGKGRRGRAWQSPPGTSISFSILLKPDIAPDNAPMITLLMAMAVADAIRKTCGLEAQIKWPNDVVVNGKKVCGILTEMSLESDYIHYVVVGTGINVNQESIPEELKETATSLSIEKGRKIVRADVLEHTIAAFEEYYETFMKTADLSMLADEYNEILVSRDKEVKVLDPKGEFSGISRGINKKGELLVELKDHSVRNIYAGEVSVRGLYGYV